jgi:hypothetical protein
LGCVWYWWSCYEYTIYFVLVNVDNVLVHADSVSL